MSPGALKACISILADFMSIVSTLIDVIQPML
jgi:hypothetical protein